MNETKLNLRLPGGIRASATLHLTPEQAKAIQTDPATALRFAAQTAVAAMAACMKSNPKWPQANKVAFATDTAAATMACVNAM